MEVSSSHSYSVNTKNNKSTHSHSVTTTVHKITTAESKPVEMIFFGSKHFIQLLNAALVSTQKVTVGGTWTSHVGPSKIYMQDTKSTDEHNLWFGSMDQWSH